MNQLIQLCTIIELALGAWVLVALLLRWFLEGLAPDQFPTPAIPEGTLPTPYQAEVAIVLGEECAEVIHRAAKLLRFGVDEVQVGQPLSNAHRLGEEVGNLLEMVDVAIEAGLVTADAVEEGRRNKRRKLAKYLRTKPS